MTNEKLVLTFTVSQWYCMPDAMQRMAAVAHGEGVPVCWQVNFETAKTEKALLDEYHRKFGDEIGMLLGVEPVSEWRELFPWARLNMTAGARPKPEQLAAWEKEAKIQGIWGYCDQQIGPDGITHWGCPWGLFYISDKTTFIPADSPAAIVGAPWTLRDLHKCYHLGQAINFTTDPIENVRSKTLCWGEDITFFQDLLDELLHNLPWNERVYCCIHEEANGPFIPPGKERSDEGATPAESEAMYEMIRHWLRYAKGQGVTITTLPDAIAEYREIAKGITLPSTILTMDKHHGSIIHYVAPLPPGIAYWQYGPAGHFPDTLFHYDNDCQLIFVHPELRPRTILNYKAQYEVKENKPYPQEPVQPSLIDWKSKRDGDIRTYFYRVQSWYRMPYGLAEWGDFRDWEVAETNCLSARIIDERVLLLRIHLEPKGKTSEEINDEMRQGFEFWVRLQNNTKGHQP